MKAFRKTNPDLARSMKSHLIGDLEEFGIADNDFDAFLQARAAAISAKLRKRLIDRPVDNRGQSQRTDDFEEELGSSE